jgi:hypothetical protein
MDAVVILDSTGRQVAPCLPVAELGREMSQLKDEVARANPVKNEKAKQATDDGALPTENAPAPLQNESALGVSNKLREEEEEEAAAEEGRVEERVDTKLAEEGSLGGGPQPSKAETETSGGADRGSEKMEQKEEEVDVGLAAVAAAGVANSGPRSPRTSSGGDGGGSSRSSRSPDKDTADDASAPAGDGNDNGSGKGNGKSNDDRRTTVAHVAFAVAQPHDGEVDDDADDNDDASPSTAIVTLVAPRSSHNAGGFSLEDLERMRKVRAQDEAALDDGSEGGGVTARRKLIEAEDSAVGTVSESDGSVQRTLCVSVCTCVCVQGLACTHWCVCVGVAVAPVVCEEARGDGDSWVIHSPQRNDGKAITLWPPLH